MGLLEWQWPHSQQMLDRAQQCADRMTRGGCTKIIGSDMQIDLRAGDQPMAEQITNGHQANAGTHQVSCKRMPQPMR